MTVLKIKKIVMHQCGEDFEDIDDYSDVIMSYINDGYFRMMEKRIGVSETNTLDALETDGDEPDERLPERYHSAIADYATYMMYRNGSTVKQNRGGAYLGQFQDAISGMPTYESDMAGGVTRLKNLYAR